MKHVWILVVSILLTSCFPKGLIRAYKSEKVNLVDGSSQGEKGKFFVPVTLNDKSVRFHFDTGANKTLLFKPEFAADAQSITMDGTLKLIDNSTVKLEMKAINYKDPFMHIDNHIVYVNHLPRDYCNVASPYDGLVGFERSIVGKRGFEINYSQGRVSSFDPSEIYARKADAYFEVPFKIKNNMAWIGITINGKVYYHLVDTGNSTAILWPKKEMLSDNLKNSFPFYGVMATSAFDIIKNPTTTIGQAEFKLGNEKSESIVFELENVSSLNAGTEFLRKYDWLFDFKNQKAYAKPTNYEQTMNIRERIAVFVKDGELMVVGLGDLQTRVKLGDTISKVNGELITLENICEWASKINGRLDYSDFVFEIKDQS